MLPIMVSRQMISLAAAALFAAGASAACNGDLQIDNWANYASAVNSMNEATSGEFQSLPGMASRTRRN